MVNRARGGKRVTQVEGLRAKDPGGSLCPLSKKSCKYVQKSWNLDLPESPNVE